MKTLALHSLVFGGVLFSAQLAAGQFQKPVQLVAAENVNSRYLVESVEIAGQLTRSVSQGLQESFRALIGTRYNAALMADLSSRLRKELHLRAVTPHVLRGSSPDHVKIVFEAERRSAEFDVSVPKFLYHSKQGWSGEVDASTTIARNHRLGFGLVSDGDELIERFAGLNASYEAQHIGNSPVKFRILFEGFHEQWNRSTLEALGPQSGDLYRERRNYQPEIAIQVAQPLTLTLGASFEQLQMQQPASRWESANAITATLHYRHNIEDSNYPQTVEMIYGLRAAGAALASDFRYTRHRVSARYQMKHGRHLLDDEFTAGYISGHAPLFERFVLGTSSMLRGWNRYEIDPLGGTRLAHNSLEYGYRFTEGTAQVFYDSGTLWDAARTSQIRHSAGASFRHGIFLVAVALPIRQTHIDPIFMVGMNY